MQASAVASASSDSAPFQAPEPAPSVEEVASAVPEVGVSLESRMAELFAELSAAEIPSSAEMPTEEYAAPEEEHAVPSLEVVDAEAVTDEPPLRLESIDATARQEEPESPSRSADVAANSDLQTLLRELHVETQPEIEPPTDEAEVESTERAAEAPAEAPVETNAAAVEEQAGAELIGCSGGHVDPRLAGGGAGRSRNSGARHDAAILGEALSQQGPAAERRADVLFLAGGQGLGAGAADGSSVATGPSSSPAAARGFLTAARHARGTHRRPGAAARRGGRPEACGGEAQRAHPGPPGARVAAFPERRPLASVARVPQPAQWGKITAPARDPSPGGNR